MVHTCARHLSRRRARRPTVGRCALAPPARATTTTAAPTPRATATAPPPPRHLHCRSASAPSEPPRAAARSQNWPASWIVEPVPPTSPAADEKLLLSRLALALADGWSGTQGALAPSLASKLAAEALRAKLMGDTARHEKLTAQVAAIRRRQDGGGGGPSGRTSTRCGTTPFHPTPFLRAVRGS